MVHILKVALVQKVYIHINEKVKSVISNQYQKNYTYLNLHPIPLKAWQKLRWLRVTTVTAVAPFLIQ